MCKTIVKLLQDISTKQLTLNHGKDNLLESIHELYKNYTVIEELEKVSGKIYPVISQTRIMKKKTEEKMLTREFIPDFFEPGHKLCVTSTKHYYLLSHLTQADLSMLDDFDIIKEELSIVNGSLITIQDPLKFKGRNLHVRDTMLLAPGGSKSLAAIGKLYGEGFEKLKVSKNQIEDMQSFLINEPEQFVEYAVRDALISLVHGL